MAEPISNDLAASYRAGQLDALGGIEEHFEWLIEIATAHHRNAVQCAKTARALAADYRARGYEQIAKSRDVYGERDAELAESSSSALASLRSAKRRLEELKGGK